MYARIGSVLAGVVKLVDALDSKSSGPWPVSVRVRPSASETPQNDIASQCGVCASLNLLELFEQLASFLSLSRTRVLLY